MELSTAQEFSYVAHVLFAGLLGSLIGLERERFVGLAGIRTYATVALGSCLFGIISFYAIEGRDPARIASQIVSGIGFLGAGVILHDHGSVKGLTTAATLWATAAVGLSVALQWYVISIFSTLGIIALLALHRVPGWLTWKFRHRPHTDDDAS